MPNEISAEASSFAQRLKSRLGSTAPPQPIGLSEVDNLPALARATAREYGIPEDLFERQIDRESQYNPRAVSGRGAKGLGQLMPIIIDAYGVKDPFDPVDNLRGSASFLRDLLDKYRDPGMALAAYNAGEPAVDQYKGIPPFRETQEYVNAILGGASAPPTAPARATPAIRPEAQQFAQLLRSRLSQPSATFGIHPTREVSPAPRIIDPVTAHDETEQAKAALTKVAEIPGRVSEAMLEGPTPMGLPGGEVGRRIAAGTVKAGLGLATLPAAVGAEAIGNVQKYGAGEGLARTAVDTAVSFTGIPEIVRQVQEAASGPLGREALLRELAHDPVNFIMPYAMAAGGAAGLAEGAYRAGVGPHEGLLAPEMARLIDYNLREIPPRPEMGERRVLRGSAPGQRRAGQDLIDAYQQGLVGDSRLEEFFGKDRAYEIRNGVASERPPEQVPLTPEQRAAAPSIGGEQPLPPQPTLEFPQEVPGRGPQPMDPLERRALERKIYKELTDLGVGGRNATVNRAELVQQIVNEMERRGFRTPEELQNAPPEAPPPGFLEDITPEDITEPGTAGAPRRPAGAPISPKKPEQMEMAKTTSPTKALIEARELYLRKRRAGGEEAPGGPLFDLASEAEAAKRQGQLPLETKKVAPATFLGNQEMPGGRPPVELWNLTEDIPGHTKGSTVSRQSLEKAGYEFPERTTAAPGPEPPAERRIRAQAPPGTRDLAFTEAGDLKEGQLKTGELIWSDRGQIRRGKYEGQAPGPAGSVLLRIRDEEGNLRHFQVRDGESRVMVLPKLEEPRPVVDHGPLSPSGKVADRSREVAIERTRETLFGKEGLPGPELPQQPSERASDLRRATELRDLAKRGQQTKKYLAEAERLEAKWKTPPEELTKFIQDVVTRKAPPSWDELQAFLKKHPGITLEDTMRELRRPDLVKTGLVQKPPAVQYVDLQNYLDRHPEATMEEAMTAVRSVKSKPGGGAVGSPMTAEEPGAPTPRQSIGQIVQQQIQQAGGTPPAQILKPAAPPMPARGKLNAHDVRRFLDKAFIPIRRRMFSGSGTRWAGIYKPDSQVARIHFIDNLPTIAHELGHHFDETLQLGGWGQATGAGRLNPAMRKELVAAGKRLYGTTIPNAGYGGEGVAEFHKFILTDPARAMREFPLYGTEWSKRMGAHPDVVKTLEEARSMIQRIEGQTALEKVSSRIRGRAERPKIGGMREFLRKWYDQYIPAKTFDEAIRSVNPESSVRLYDRMFEAQNFASMADELLRHRMLNRAEDTVGPGFTEITKPVKEHLDRLDDLLVARATLERNPLGKYTGIKTKDAELAIQEMETSNPALFAKLEKAAAGLYKFQDQMLDLAVEYGVVTPEGAAAMRETYAMYAPLHRFMEEPTTPAHGEGLGSPFKRAKGGEQEILRPTENIVKNVYSMAYRIGQQRIGMELLKASREPGVGRFIEHVPLPMEPKSMQVKDVIQSLGKTHPSLAVYLKTLPEHVQEAVVSAFRPSSEMARRKGLLTVQMGDRTTGLLLGDPVLRDTLTGLNREGIAEWSKNVGRISSVLRTGATVANPEFPLTNLARDQITAFLGSDYGFVPLFSPLKSIPDLVFNSPQWKEYRTKGVQQAQLLQLDRQYLGGGIADVLAGRKVPSVQGVIPRAQALTKSSIRLVTKPLRLVPELNGVIENLTRFSEYRLARKAGSDKLAAMRAAQEVSVNFQRTGANMRALSIMTPFYRANINALGRLGNIARHHPGRTAARLGIGIALPAAILHAVNSDDPDYQAIPQRVRDLYFMFKLSPTKWVRLPKPDLPGVLIGTGVERALDYWKGMNPGDYKLWAAQILRANAPGTFGLPIPSPLLTGLEEAANYSFFWNDPIVPEHKRNLIPELQARGFTGPTARRLARTTGVPAARIEHMVSGTFGGAGTMALRTSDLAGTAAGVFPKPIPEAGLPSPYSSSRIPVVRRFIYELPPAEKKSRLSEAEYNERQRGEGLMASWRQLLRTGTEEEKQAFKRDYGPELRQYMKRKSDLDAKAKEGKKKNKPIRLQDVRRTLGTP